MLAGGFSVGQGLGRAAREAANFSRSFEGLVSFEKIGRENCVSIDSNTQTSRQTTQSMWAEMFAVAPAELETVLEISIGISRVTSPS